MTEQDTEPPTVYDDMEPEPEDDWKRRALKAEAQLNIATEELKLQAGFTLHSMISRRHSVLKAIVKINTLNEGKET